MKNISIKDCEHYLISKCGKIINGNTGRELKFDSNSCGYARVTFWSKKGERVRRFVHRLVAEHFIPSIEGKRYVNHKDGDKTNNHKNNLEWVTSSENSLHAFDKGLRKVNKVFNLIPANREFDEDFIDKVIELQRKGMKRRHICEKLDITESKYKNLIKYKAYRERSTTIPRGSTCKAIVHGNRLHL